ncbi:Na(+)/H(+) antiporter subunit B [Magnetovibrio sp.]|uniref:Na(+)/H(+) antiporter subunit B n=1 Tax=Magnetovibrio sp. TaxID=2024836 RepID=UPI002F93181A
MMVEKPLLRVIAKLLIPLIMLFAFYVQFHGDFGPGGGFQAGVILAVAFILYALIFGVRVARRVIPAAVSRNLLALGVLIYGGTGVATLLLGGEFLDYNVLASTVHGGQHLGIFVVEFGVGMTVAGAMITIFYTFAGHVNDELPFRKGGR